MAEQSLEGLERYGAPGAESDRSGRVGAQRLDADRFSLVSDGEVWVGDITYLKVADTWRYLAIVMDQYSRRILAWSLTAQRSASVTCTVFARVACARPARGVIFHSDRGSEYMGAPFRTLLLQHGVLQSAGVRGPGENAHAESFFHSLKAEVTRGVTYHSQPALRTELARYVYNYVPLALEPGTTNLLLPSNGRRRKTIGANESGAGSRASYRSSFRSHWLGSPPAYARRYTSAIAHSWRECPSETGTVHVILRFYIDPETDAPHIHLHGVDESEVEDVLRRPIEDRPGREGARVAIGQTRAGRYLRVVYVPDPAPDDIFVLTAFDLGSKPLRALRRRRKKKP